MTAPSPVEDKARNREKSGTCTSLHTARSYLASSAALAQQHLQEGVGEDVDSLSTAVAQVGAPFARQLLVLTLWWASGPCVLRAILPLKQTRSLSATM